MTDEQHIELGVFSNGLATAVERAAASTVLVAARRHVPASGVVWSDDGLVVTADHAIEFEDDITIGLPDGSEIAAQLVGRDPSSDLALLRIEGGVPTAALAPEGSAKVGHLALAVARPSAAGPQASLGIISAIAGPADGRGRRAHGRAPARLEGYLRTDVTFFPGFSGGPLVDIEGRVLGINVSLIGGPRAFRFARGAFGQGFTVDAASVTRTVELLKTHGRVRRAYLGIASQPVALAEPAASAAGQAEGLLIVGVEAGTPAAQGGLLVGDILVGIEDAPVRDADDLQRALTPERVGAAVRLQLIRGGAAHELSVTLGARE
ncbi:MAG: S1C family serine protease [Dehalococcoidia bacterium]